jgi:hypothetical protein
MADQPENAPDPVAAMFDIPDEQLRQNAPDAELNPEPPADKDPPARDETGKFKGKDEKVADPAAKEPEKAPEAKQPEKQPDKPVERRDDAVPLAKFLDTQNKLRAEIAAKEAAFQKELQALRASIPKAPEPPEPDFVENPKGYVDHKLEKTLAAIEAANKKAEEQGKQAQETAQAATEQVQLRQFLDEIGSQERAFVAQTPDYYDALGHLRTIRANQLRELVPDITDQQIRETIQREEIVLAVNIKRSGRDPMQVAYNLAKHHGYTKKEAAAAAAAEPPPVAKLPDPPARRLPPDQTLGSGAGGDTPVYKEGEQDPVDIALASLRRARA